ncbi:MAG: (4Fe-4S)-binding protein, partial [Thermoplasmata archaeon]|nr:(4Fe-4S)-binding protein [Thermoplasmata archaeon]
MILPKDKLDDWLAALKRRTLFAPIENDGVIRFTHNSDPKEIVLTGNSTGSPKGVIFPQTETIFLFDLGEKKCVTSPDSNKERIVVFGIHPCDARSFTILDHVFGGDFKDEYYLSRRENTTLIGLTCNEPFPNCFCTSLDGSPGTKDDVDILLTDLGDRYLVEVITDKGKALVGESSSLFAPSKDEDIKKKEEIVTRSEGLMKRNVDVNGVPEKLALMFESGFWEEISRKCLGCGVCTYLCPTCHCFDVQD